MDRREFKRRVTKILAEDVNSGSFTRSGIDAQGSPCTHRFAWASGMASTMWEAKYREAFRHKLPGWTALCNPYHVSRICEQAIGARMRLPARHPAIGESS